MIAAMASDGAADHRAGKAAGDRASRGIAAAIAVTAVTISRVAAAIAVSWIAVPGGRVYVAGVGVAWVAVARIGVAGAVRISVTVTAVISAISRIADRDHCPGPRISVAVRVVRIIAVAAVAVTAVAIVVAAMTIMVVRVMVPIAVTVPVARIGGAWQCDDGGRESESDQLRHRKTPRLGRIGCRDAQADSRWLLLLRCCRGDE